MTDNPPRLTCESCGEAVRPDVELIADDEGFSLTMIESPR